MQNVVQQLSSDSREANLLVGVILNLAAGRGGGVLCLSTGLETSDDLVDYM